MHGSESIDNEEFLYTHEDIIILITVNCRVSTPKAIEFKEDDIILTKEQSVISKITKIFWKEETLVQHL